MTNTVIYALVGGILPALVWLIFWLREDRKNPEPRLYIFTTFVLGMAAVLIITVGALIFNEKAEQLVAGITPIALLILATIEELLKFGAGYIGGLRTKEDNEPVDAMIYMITAALGFVALENTLFIFGPLIDGKILESIITGNMRFIGASLLHVVSSGIVGVALASVYYKSYPVQMLIAIMAIGAAIAFHFLFNLIILSTGNQGGLWSAIMVWVGVIFLLWAFERAKAIAR